MLQDGERALAVERSAVVSVRIDLVQLAVWTKWMDKAGIPASSVNQAVSSALGFAVDILRANGHIDKTPTLGESVTWLDERRLFQRRMLGKKKQKLGAFMTFESLRMEGENPRMSDGLTRQTYEVLHGNDERVVLPLKIFGKENVEVGEGEVKKVKTYEDRKIEKLTDEDKEKLKEIWIAMTEDEKAVFQRTVYQNSPAGEQERIDAFMMFYPRFRGDYPKEYENATAEVCLSNEYQEWMDEYYSKKDAFVWAMGGLIPELVNNKKRLETNEDGVIINVPSTGAGIITKEEHDEHMRQEEENKRNAMKEREKDRLMRREAAKEAKKELGMIEEEEEPKKPKEKYKGEIPVEEDEEFLAELNAPISEEED
jgi:hypothetical protein